MTDLPSAICHPPSAIRHLLSAICYPPSAIRHLMKGFAALTIILYI
ncbi:MAG: hypothetical protein ACOYM0_12470 [Bacteroidales bacterium]